MKVILPEIDHQEFLFATLRQAVYKPASLLTTGAPTNHLFKFAPGLSRFLFEAMVQDLLPLLAQCILITNLFFQVGALEVQLIGINALFEECVTLLLT